LRLVTVKSIRRELRLGETPAYVEQLFALAELLVGLREQVQPLGCESLGGGIAHGAAQEVRSRFAELVLQRLDASPAAVIVDHDVDKIPADSTLSRRSIAVDAMSWTPAAT
jgi:hypothetical protein